MKRLSFTVLLIVFCNFNLFAQTNVTKEEYAVYASVFESIYAENFKPNGFKTSFVISEDTVKLDFVPPDLIKPKSVLDFTNEKFPFNLENLSKDFRKRNKYSTKFERQFSIEYEYNIVSKSEKDKLLEDGKKEYEEILRKSKDPFFGSRDAFYWQPFHRKYKNSG